MASVASSSSPGSGFANYDVFLSFRGQDTRKTFTDHLFRALVDAGFRTFRDDDGIERGEDIKLELEKAIKESRISIVVLSKGYASSRWCLDELVMILQRKTTSKHDVLPVFYHVDPSDVRKQRASFGEAIARHEERFKAESVDWMGKVEGWRGALKQVADLAGFSLQNQANGYESVLIDKIVKHVLCKLQSRIILSNDPNLIGMDSRAKKIQMWLEDKTTNPSICAICGMGGIGKTTLAKFLYNHNFTRFEGASFLADVRRISGQPDGLLSLQRKLLKDIVRGKKEKVDDVHEGIVKIQNALHFRKVLIVFDDVDDQEQLDKVIGFRDWLSPGSKIIITTRKQRLLRAHENCLVQRMEMLNRDDSLELFSWHAFCKKHPDHEFLEVSNGVVQHCGGLPLALKVLGASLSTNMKLDAWKSQLEKLKKLEAGVDKDILEILKISYDSLDDFDKKLFLHIACLFVGECIDESITILQELDFYTRVGFENLINGYLLDIETHTKTLVMHELLQEMGRKIIYQESPNEAGERSIIWNHKDSFHVLKQNTGTRKVESLTLDMRLLTPQTNNTAKGAKQKRPFEESIDSSLFTSLGDSIKRLCIGKFSWRSTGIVPKKLNQESLEADAFVNMHRLRILQLDGVCLIGNYAKIPKSVRYLRWHGFHLNSIPNGLSLDELVILDMCYSKLTNVWEFGKKDLIFLKILNLSYSDKLAKTGDFSLVPNLERLVLESCESLVEVHESIGFLRRLVVLNLRNCKNLKGLPTTIGGLEVLETLDISGCSNLNNLPTELRNLGSLRVLDASGIGRLVNEQSWVTKYWSMTLVKSPKIILASLLQSLVELSIRSCNLSNDDFPEEFSKLISLEKLNVGGNPILSLPNCIKELPRIQRLVVNYCKRLRWLTELPKSIRNLYVYVCNLLETVRFVSFPSEKPLIFGDGCENIVEVEGMFKLEPLGDMDADIIKNLGLSDFISTTEAYVKLLCWKALFAKAKKRPIQVLSTQLTGMCGWLDSGRHRCNSETGIEEIQIFITYIPGQEVPDWFFLKKLGTSISFRVPSNVEARVQGLAICVPYIYVPDNFLHYMPFEIIIENKTLGKHWTKTPEFFGILDDNMDTMLMLSYWKFENNYLNPGDELNIFSLGSKFHVIVKEVGVRLLYSNEQEVESLHSTIQLQPVYTEKAELFGFSTSMPVYNHREQSHNFEGKLKLNVNARKKSEEDGPNLFGGVFRDEKGIWILGYTGCWIYTFGAHKIKKVYDALLAAVYEGLVLIYQKGWSSQVEVEVEVNSQFLVHMLLGGPKLLRKYHYRVMSNLEALKSCQYLLRKFKWVVKYTINEWHQVTEELANLAIPPKELVILENPPAELELEYLLKQGLEIGQHFKKENVVPSRIQGKLKLNVGVSLESNDLRGGFGGVIRDERGKWILGYRGKRDKWRKYDVNNDDKFLLLKVEAIEEGLFIICQKLFFPNVEVEVEVDSEPVVRACRSSMIEGIKWTITCAHNEWNQVSKRLANLVIDQNKDLEILEEPPEELKLDSLLK